MKRDRTDWFLLAAFWGLAIVLLWMLSIGVERVVERCAA